MSLRKFHALRSVGAVVEIKEHRRLAGIVANGNELINRRDAGAP
jgi:hypothetical protein